MSNELTPKEATSLLEDIYQKIEDRTQAAQEDRPIWPCRKGCDLCCRRLADPPSITKAEWTYLAEGIAQLSSPEQENIHSKIKVLQQRDKPSQRFVVCPLLNEEAGACRVYHHRPAACRMYGFYVSRHNNQWCQEIEELNNTGQLDGVVLGNFTTTTQRLQQCFGEEKSILTWYKEDPPKGNAT